MRSAGQAERHHRAGAGKPWRGAPVRLAGVVRRSRRALLLGTALQATVVLVLALPARAQVSPDARPTGGVVVGGAASIAASPTATTITQTSQRAALDWRSFDVGSNQAVDFRQPSAAAVALNRVTGPNPSQIAGQINANGQVILENQDGITFLKGAQVNTAGLVATTSGITNQNFMAGHMVFDRPGAPGAALVNQGHITVREAGIAALVAPQVANSGVIAARLGRVVLAGATRYTLDLYGDGLVSIDVTGAVTQVPAGPRGATVPALVTNTGTILAEGGQIELTAREAGGLVQALVSAGGLISAPSIAGRTGRIVLNGIGGSIVVAGALLARGAPAGTAGGAIEVAPSGGDVHLVATAVIDASGPAGGGTVAIGTDLARASGGPSVRPAVLARNVTIARGARIAANATGKGNGGHVTVLASEQTVMDGAISATGGPGGGDGGFVEVSGQSFRYGGAIDVAAGAGQVGHILFDPGTLDIVAGTGGSLDSSLGTIAFGAGTIFDTVSNGAINAFGATADVVLQATTLLDVQASVSVAHGLTLQSGGNLLVDAGISVQAGSLLSLGAGIASATGAATQAGGITLGGATGTAALLQAGTVVLQGGTLGGIALNQAGIGGTLVDLGTGGGGIGQSGTGAILAGTLRSSGGIGGTASLLGSGNSIATIGSIAVAGGDFILNEAGASAARMTVNGPVSAGNIAITGAGTLLVPGTVLATTHAFLGASGAGGITIGATGAVGATTAAGTVSLQGDAISLVRGGTVIAGTLEVASFGPSVLQLGSVPPPNPSSLSLDTLLNQGETLLRIGAVTPIGGTPTITASAITIARGFGVATVGLELDANGPIIEGGGPTDALTTPRLTGVVNGGSVVLNENNQIASLGGFTVIGGALTVVDVTTAAMTITGPVIAPSGAIHAGTIDVTGTIASSGSGSLQLESFTGTLGIDAGASLSAGTIGLSAQAAGTRVNIGTGSATAVVNATSLLAFSGAGVNEGASGTIIAGTLTSSATITGPVTLAGTANAIGTLGAFTVAAGDLVLADPGAATLAIPGSLLANNITLGAAGAPGAPGAIDINGGTIALNSGGMLVALNAGTGGITLANSAAMSASTVSLATTGGGVREDASSALTAGTLLGAGTVTGAVSLAGTANVIGTLGAFTVAAGDLVLTEGTGLALAVTGPVTVDSGRHVGIAADTLALGGVVNAGTGTFAWSPAVSGDAMTLAAGGPNGGSIVAAEADFGLAGGAGSSIVASAITIAGSFGLGAGATLGLFAAGTIAEVSGGTIATGLLVGAATGAGLANANSIATLGSFAAGTGALDVNNGGGLIVAGPVSGAGVTLSGGAVTITGSVGLSGGGSVIAVGAGNGGISLSSTGTLDAGSGTVALGTSGGGVGGGGAILAGTLTSFPTIVGTAALTGANTIDVLGGFTVAGGDLVLADPGATRLSVPGTVLANDVTIGPAGSLAPGTLAINSGTIALTGGALVALRSGTGGIALSGTALLNAGSAGTVAFGGGGGASESTGARIVAGTLTSLPTLAATATLTGSNTIGAIGGFTVTGGDLLLADAGTATLAVPGNVVANDVSIGPSSNLSPSALDINSGTIALNPGGTTVALRAGAGGIALNGTALVNAGGGTVALGSAGGVTQSSTAAIVAGTLASLGSIVGTASLTGANSIAALGDFQAGTLALNDTRALGIAGTLIAGLVTLSAGGTIEETGGTVDVASLTASGTGGISLLGAGNTVGGFGNVAAIGSGSVLLSDAAAATVTGTIAAPGSVYLQDTAAGGVTIAGGGSIAAGSIATAGVQADHFVNNGSVSGGVFELAPETTGRVVSLGSGGGGLALGSLGGIAAPIARIGQITLPGGTSTITAGSIAIVGSIGAATIGLDLVATGAITEVPGAMLTAATLAASGSSIALAGTTNAIALAQGVTATAGDATLIDRTNLTLAGTIGGSNLFVEVVLAGGTLALGTATPPGLRVAASGRITLIADRMTEGTGSGGTIAAPGGTVELAPFTPRTRVSLNGTAGTQLLLDPTLLFELRTSALAVGGYTDIPGGGTLVISAGGIGIDGPVTLGAAQADTLDLLSMGGITEAAGTALGVGTLIGGIQTGAVALGGANTVGTLAGFAAPGTSFALTDASSLAVTGTVSSGSVTLSAGGIGLDPGADVTGTTVTLIATAGTVGIGNGGTALVDAGSVLALGGIGAYETATGTIIAGTLAGAGALTGGVDLSQGTNSIGVLGAITIAGGGLALSDSVSTLSIAGPASAANIAIGGGSGTPGAIVVPGSIAAGNTLSLAAGPGGITVGGTASIGAPNVSLVTPGTVGLNAGLVSAGTTGTVTLGGSLGIVQAAGATLIAGRLQSAGTIAGAAVFDGTANDILSLGDFTVSGADFTLSDAVPVLTVAGALTARDVAIGGGALGTPGSVVVTGGIATTGSLLALTVAGGIAINGGTVAAGSGSAVLTGAAGATIAINGSLGGGTVAFGGATSVTESGAAVLAAGLLTSEVALGNVSLTGPVNAIGTLGVFTSTGTIAIDPSARMRIVGPVAGADVAIASSASLDVTGRITATGGTVALGGDGLGLDGASVAATTVVLNGQTAGATIAASSGTPSVIDATVLALGGAGVTEDAASSITAGALVGAPSVSGAISLPGSANAIASIDGLTESAGAFTLTDTGPLTLAGPFTAPSIAVSSSGTTPVAVSGAVTATSGTLAITSGSGGIAIGAGGDLTGAPVVLNAGTGPIYEAPTGRIDASGLQGATSATASLGGANAIATLGPFTASGGLVLDDGGNVTLTGAVQAGPLADFSVSGVLGIAAPLVARTVQITAGGLSDTSVIDAPTEVVLALAGGAGESGVGAIDTALLTGAAGGSADLNGANQVGELADFSAGAVLTLDNAAPLLVAGTIRAPTISITTTPYQVTIANGAVLVTGGIAHPTSPPASDAFPSAADGGAYFSDFVSQGGFTVASIAGGPSILRIDAYNGGSVTFGGTGVNGPSTWLVVDLHGAGSVLGTASGQIAVAALNVVFPSGSAGGGANFTGTIGGFGGQAAAGVGQVSPQPDSRFRFDSCAIGSVNCIVLPLEVLPIGNPLQEFSIGALMDSDDSDDLFLPLVSRRDY